MRGARYSFIGLFLVYIFGSLQTAESEVANLQPLLRSEVLAQEARSLTHLDEIDPYAFGLHSAKLTTPQWIGEEGVESAVVLSIDDLSDATKYENYLRPILNRLKEIDGRAGMTITANRPKPDEPLIQKWLEEGVSIEAHTTKHACPMLCKSDLAENKADYDQCVDLLFSIPNNEPVGFRVPCCDSMNATSPRFFAELFGKTTPNGNFLTLDSSVFTIFTPDDPALPKDLVEEPDGRGRFQKYVPEDRGFVNSIENYPYPYTIGNFCWELPGVMPSDWNAFHFHEAYNPYTVEDLQSAIDITAIKQGLFTLVFHPHGWIRNDQIVSLIDHAVFHHGNKIKFLSFKEVSDRLTENLLLGQSIRNEKGEDNGVRILDLNGDGFMDVVIGNDNLRITRVWNPEKNEWIDFSFPVSFHSVDGDGNRFSNGIRFGIFGENSQVGFLYANGNESRGWLFDGSEWVEEKDLVPATQGFVTSTGGKDTGVRLIDLNGDGSTELLNGGPNAGQVLVWKCDKWESLPFSLPKNVQIVDNQGGDFGTRFVDLDDDLDLDLVCSNEKGSAVYLFQDMETGWGDAILDEKPGSEDALPLIARDGTNNGAWFHSRALWVNNENTDQLENKVAKKTFNEMLRDARLPSISKEAALKSIHTRPGFEVELVAAEPFVKDPVAYSWGPDGKLWVVEMADYPEGIDNEGKPGGRVRYLEDTDRDGDYDRSTLFLDGLTFPNGILPWHDGVLITSAPDILYAEDTDGDGKADRKETLYTGFGNINEQHLINGLRWGLDNWVYCANGDSGGDIRSLKTGKTVELRGQDLRLKPDEGLLEAIEGEAQFGRPRDDWGNWFGCANPNPMWHYVQKDSSISRNPYLAAPRFRNNVSVVPGPSPVFPVSRTLARFNDPWAVNRFTSACSTMVYRDDLLGSLFAGNSFVCEPVHNLVHREIMEPDGATFSSHRAIDERNSEFFASTDNWSRPVMTRTGPDGALWIADMYREQIEHPAYVPEELQVGIDFRAGEDRGRIYRVYPAGSQPKEVPVLTGKSPEELAKIFETINGTVRDMVHAFIVQDNKTDCVEPFRKLVTKSTLPVVRMQALCVLDGLGALEASDVLHALNDEHPGVVRHAVRLSENWIEDPKITQTLGGLTASATDAFLCQQLAYTLGEWDDQESGPALAQLTLRVGEDSDLRASILSSLHEKNLGTFANALATSRKTFDSLSEFWTATAEMAMKIQDSETLAVVIGQVTDHANNPLDQQRLPLALQLIASLPQMDFGSEGSREALEGFSEKLFAEARKILDDSDSTSEQVVVALEVLNSSGDKSTEDYEHLASFLTPYWDWEIQEKALQGFQSAPVDVAAEELLSGWREHSPELREEILSLFFKNKDWLSSLLSRIEENPAIGKDLDARQKQVLLKQSDPEIRERAEKVLNASINPDRAKVLEAYGEVASLAGDPTAGRPIFEERCSKCHQLRGIGRALGPDLAALTDHSNEALMVAVLDPNRSVESKYRTYMAETVDGFSYSGLLTNESGNSITLAMDDGEEATLLRSDLELFQGSTLSFMPEGLEVGLTPQGLADLFAFVRESGPPMKKFKGNEPIVVTPEPYRREIWLLSTTGEIYGDTLVMEDRFNNLGYWGSMNDHACWNFKVEEPGDYSVWLDYSCGSQEGANTFAIDVAGQRVIEEVDSTGDWETYRIKPVGEVTLAEGLNRLTIRPFMKLDGYLMDLKSIALKPERE